VRWLPLIALPALMLAIVPPSAPRWALMWLLAATIYIGCKWLSWFAAARPPAPPWRKLAWSLAWPGMDANRFLAADSPRRRVNGIEWTSACFKTFLGIGLFIVAGKLIATVSITVGAWVGMIGFILSIHCGLFHLLSCVWRSICLRSEPLMNRPLAARTVTEFWGRRWNRAFRDLTYSAIFRPLATRYGPAIGTIVVFGFSGLVHDLVISIPAAGGFGLPTLYFLIQGVAVLLESRPVKVSTRSGHNLLGRTVAAVVIAAPLPLLFHPPFVNAVVVPFLKTISP
jgi:alginate O-acetyltransferase complex protein AlgI